MVSYNDRPVINHLSWTVNPGEHWQIVGPNGAGKSTLLSLVTGDHPQGYSNDLTLFGRRRGSGETIWDIKKHIGYVSSSLHLDYRVSTNVRNVILSGYFDSIGIYQAVSDKQHKLVQQWLDILGIDKRTADAPFHSLSWGQQRLALIVRALVKHPTLLILDEPLQGLEPPQPPAGAPLCRRVDWRRGHTAAVCLAPCGRCPGLYYPSAWRSFPVETVTLISSAPWPDAPCRGSKDPWVFFQKNSAKQT
ncbi:Putative molybdenum transport ATP-binding protein modF [Klebsiella aerogenes]|nr:Putative molybdenum transport ATP-binding protein modF [Klebsiella aerogenes]